MCYAYAPLCTHLFDNIPNQPAGNCCDRENERKERKKKEESISRPLCMHAMSNLIREDATNVHNRDAVCVRHTGFHQKFIFKLFTFEFSFKIILIFKPPLTRVHIFPANSFRQENPVHLFVCQSFYKETAKCGFVS